MVSEDQQNKPLSMDEVEIRRPKLYFETITFSDGTTLKLAEDDIVVFVGPNNAGKSAALRELEGWVAQSHVGDVVKNATMTKKGTQEDFRTYLEAKAQKSGGIANLHYGGIGYNIHHTHLEYFDNPANRSPVAPFFAKQLTTAGRLSDSNAAPGIALFQDPPTHPIHLLLMDQALSQNISDKFKHAFGKDLTPFRAGGSSFPLYVGDKPVIPHGKDELSKEFVDALLGSNVLLQTQGDGMRSFAAVMLHALADAPIRSSFSMNQKLSCIRPKRGFLVAILRRQKGVNPLNFSSPHTVRTFWKG